MDSYCLLFVCYFGACAIICWNRYCLVLQVPLFVGFIQIKYNWFYHVTAINDWIYSESNGPF